MTEQSDSAKWLSFMEGAVSHWDCDDTVSVSWSGRRWAGNVESRMLEESLCWDHLPEDADFKRFSGMWQGASAIVPSIKN